MKRIIVDSAICHGKPVVKGTRIMVSNILSLFAGGYTISQILDHYPELSVDDIKESVQYAVQTIQDEDILFQ